MRPLEIPPELLHELETLRRRVSELEQDQHHQARQKFLPDSVTTDHYKLLYENTPSMSFALATDGTVISVNQFGVEQLGYDAGQLIGQSVLLVFDPADHETVRNQLRLCEEHPYKIFQWEIQKVHKSGGRLWVRETARSVRNNHGNLIILVMCEDITARKETEEQARSLTTALETIIHTSPLAIVALDTRGDTVTLWNQSAERMFGWSAQEVLGKRVPFLPSHCQAESDHLWDQLVEEGSLQGVELQRVRRDGTPIILSLWATLLRDQQGNIVNAFGLLADITERKRMESALRLNEQSVQELCEITSDVTAEFDQKLRALLDLGRRRFQLPIAAFTTLKDRQLKPVIIRSDNPIINEEVILPLCETLCGKALAADHPLTFQHLGTSRMEEHPSVTLRQFETYLGSRITVHGRPVGTICFLSDESVPGRFSEADLDFLQLMARWVSGELERQQAETRLRDSEERFRLMFENAPVGMAIVGADKKLKKVNPSFQRLVGYTEEEITGNTYALYTHPDDLRANLLVTDQFFRGDISGYHLEKRYIRKDGRLIWVAVTASSLQLPGESDRLLLALIEDITARKQATEALRESENRLRALYDQAPLGIAIIDSIEGRFEQVNQKYCEITGYSKEDMLARTFQDITYPDDLQKDLDNMTELLSGRIDSFRMEKRYIRKDGLIVWVNLTCVPLWLDASDRRLHIAMVEDITERKRTEEALQASETRFREIAETIEEVVWSADPAIGKTLYISPAYERIWGRTCANLYENPKSFLDAIHPDDLPRIIAGLAVQRDGLPFAHEYRVVQPDGAIRWVWDRGFPVKDHETGRITHYVGVALDITDRKQAEQEISLFRNRLQYLLTASPAVIYSCKPSGDFGATYVSDNVFEQTGYRPHEFIDDSAFWISHVHPDDLQGILEDLPALFEQGSHTLEYRFLHKDGSYRWMHDQLKLIRDASGDPIEILGCWIDISDRRYVETQLQLTQHAVDHAGDLIFWISRDAQFLYVNDAAAQRLGYTPQELRGMTVADIDPNYQNDIWPQHWEELKRQGKLRFESSHRTKSGELYPAEIVANYVNFGGQEYNFAFARDISGRRAAEEALRSSEERFSKAFLSSPHPIVVTELESGRCIEANDASLQLFGFQRDEVIGQSTVSLGIWPNLDDRQEFLERIKREGSVRNLERTFHTKDRIKRRCLVSCELIELNGIKCVVTVGTDVTEQKRAEEALRRSEQAVRQAFDERERLSQDLHDNLLQSLYAVGMGLDLTRQKLQRISQANAKNLECSVNQLNEVIREVRNFIPRMQPPVVEGETVAEAIRSLANSLESSGAGPVKLCIDDRPTWPLTPEQSAHLIAIAREALSNSVRHAGATERTVTLRVENGVIRLKIADNGRGFIVNRRRVQGLGLINMRARARKINARISITSSSQRGTLVSLTVPLR